jgi:glycosyltransferase involved in cell wall biosynthesis
MRNALELPMTSSPTPTSPRVAVIIRTKGRPVFLDRALDSIRRQSISPNRVVVVSDGPPDTQSVAVVARYKSRGVPVGLVEHTADQGIEAMSNVAIRTTDCELVAIHDDDDTWSETFLAKTCAFLADNRAYGGVISHSHSIVEEVTATGIAPLKQVPLQVRLAGVSLVELAIENLFPPISFVYRREIFDLIGGYDESLRTLGDWDFNLRFLARIDIGVVPEVLAFHHLRAAAHVDAHRNLLGFDAIKYQRQAALVRNKYARRLDQDGADKSLATVMTMASAVDVILSRLKPR